MSARKHVLLALPFFTLLLLIMPTVGRSQERPAGGVRADGKDEGELPDLSRLHPFHRAVFLSSRRGAEWLWQANRPDGLFVHGYVPALNTELAGDHYLHQAWAAVALARAARCTAASRYTVRARQALLALLASTKTDATDPGVRFTVFPATEVNRVAAASLLALAIQELPEPGQDLVDQSEQLCQFLVRQQQADGAFKVESAQNPDHVEYAEAAPGLALCALIRSHQTRPAPWKLEGVRKGLTCQTGQWAKQKQPAAAPWLACAATDAYLLTKDKAYAEFAFAVADWLCSLQYGTDPRHPLWQGGFARWQDGKAVATPPGVESARWAEAIARTARAAREAADVQRFERYRESSERCLQFLTTLQYTSANTRHFADWYKPQLYGAFYASHQDGTVRLDYTQAAVCAMTEYLESVAQVKR